MIINSIKNKIVIIGFGKLGSHLYYSLKNAGYKNVNKITKKSSDGIINDSARNSEIIFICSRDGEIENIARKLKSLKINSGTKYVFHTSGALDSGILKAVKSKNIFIASFHPVQTFDSPAKNKSGYFENIYIALEGDKEAVKIGTEIARKIGSKPILLSKESKILHHICSVFLSNYLIALFSQIPQILQKSLDFGNNKSRYINGFNNVNFFDIYEPIIKSTLLNIKNKGIVDSLTGPIVRNDLKTIEIHLETLKMVCPELIYFYIFMGAETIKIAITKKSIRKKDADKIIILFKKYLKTQ